MCQICKEQHTTELLGAATEAYFEGLPEAKELADEFYAHTGSFSS